MQAIIYKGRTRLHIKQRNSAYYGTINYKTERLEVVIKDDRVDRINFQIKIHAAMDVKRFIKEVDDGKVSSEFSIERF